MSRLDDIKERVGLDDGADHYFHEKDVAWLIQRVEELEAEYQGNEEDLTEVMERIGKTARKLMPGEPPKGYRTGFGIAPRHALMLIGRIEELEAENARLRAIHPTT